MSNLQDLAKLHEIRRNYFECHTIENVDQDLNQILQGYLAPDEMSQNTRLQIANKVYTVHDTLSMLRKLDTQAIRSADKAIDELFDIFSPDEIGNDLSDMLSAWICPTDHIREINSRHAANCVGLVSIIITFLYGQFAVYEKARLQCA